MAASASGSGTGSDDVADMMKKLGLSEEDLDDVVVEDEEEIPAESTRWMVIARVHMDKPYSQYWSYRNMRAAWDLAKEVKIRPLKTICTCCNFPDWVIGSELCRKDHGPSVAMR
jgi:hypothetical protein